MKLLLKLLLSVTLLGVVVGVSYLKTVSDRDSNVDNKAKEEIASATIETTQTDKKVALSKTAQTPKSEVAEEVATKSKSSTKTNKTPAETKTPVVKPTEAKPPKILALTSQDKVVEEKKSKQSAAKSISATGSNTEEKKNDAANSDKRTREEQIVLYFKNKLSALPDDLSSYEKKIAIKEVRDETCELFHISRTKLNQLARVHKITYP